jgi:hypothetical protein
MGFYPVAVYYNNTHHTQKYTAQKTTKTIKDTLHTMNLKAMLARMRHTHEKERETEHGCWYCQVVLFHFLLLEK